MKILRIIARLNVGGPARHVIWLTSALRDAEFESVLVTGTVPPTEEDMTYFAEDAGVQPVFVREMSRELSLSDVFALIKIYRAIKAEKPDIVHTHTAKAGTVGRIAALFYRWLTWRTLIGRPRRLKVVHTFHGHVFHSYYGTLKTRVFLAIEKFLARVATDRIVVISAQQLAEIHGRFGVGRSDQFEVIPLGIDLDYLSNGTKRDDVRRALGAKSGDFVVGFVGRLTEVKNVPLLIDVAALCAAEGGRAEPNVQVVIVGDGSLREELEAHCDQVGARERVLFLGHRRDVAELVSAFDAVAITSRNEGTPLSLIEAMAAGVPVISTAVGGVRDLLGDIVESKGEFSVCSRGIAVNSQSPQAFFNGLIYLVKNEKLRERSAAEGRRFVIETYSKERLIGDIRRLYRDLMDA